MNKTSTGKLKHGSNASLCSFLGEGSSSLPCYHINPSIHIDDLGDKDPLCPDYLAPSTAPEKDFSKDREIENNSGSSFNSLFSPGASFFSESKTSVGESTSSSESGLDCSKGKSSKSTTKRKYPFLNPKAPQNWISKLMSQRRMFSTSVKGNASSNTPIKLSKTINSEKPKKSRDNIHARQFPFPTANRYSSPNFSERFSVQTSAHPTSLGQEKSDLSQNNVSSTPPKSFFDFFEIAWNEKSPNHGKEVARSSV